MSKIENQIKEKMEKELSPFFLQVLNESDNHHGPPGRESHFKIILVSKHFSGLNRVQRHQKIYSLLEDELKSPIHALALKLYDIEDWARFKGTEVLESPECSNKK